MPPPFPPLGYATGYIRVNYFKLSRHMCMVVCCVAKEASVPHAPMSILTGTAMWRFSYIFIYSSVIFYLNGTKLFVEVPVAHSLMLECFMPTNLSLRHAEVQTNVAQNMRCSVEPLCATTYPCYTLVWMT